MGLARYFPSPASPISVFAGSQWVLPWRKSPGALSFAPPKALRQQEPSTPSPTRPLSARSTPSSRSEADKNSGGTGIPIRQPKLARFLITGGFEESHPRLLFVPDRRQLPNAESRLVCFLAGKQREIRHGVPVLVENGLPYFVGAAPGADDQEIEIAPATMEDDKAKSAGIQRSFCQVGSGQRADCVRHRLIFAIHRIPFQHTPRRLQYFAECYALGPVSVFRTDPQVAF